MFKIGTCGRCEWIAENIKETKECPKCGFGGWYSARKEYGDYNLNDYRYSQRPWMRRKVIEYKAKLLKEVADPRPKKKDPLLEIILKRFENHTDLIQKEKKL